MRRLIALMLCLITKQALADEPANYYIPPTGFNAGLEIMQGGFSNSFALFQNATGSFSFDESSKSISHLRLAIDANSLMSNNPAQVQELGQLLASSQSPEIRITGPDSTGFTDGKAELKANLTLHGTTKPVTFQATLNRTGKTANIETIGLSLTGLLKRADFGMVDEANAFGDTLTLRLEIQAIRQ